jgi:hypothetical protein
MKTIIIISSAILLVAFSNINNSITLQEAMDKNLVAVKIKSVGSYQGESAIIELHNLTKNTLKIDVEAGRKLIAGEDPYQNLLVVRQEQLIVNAGAKTSKKIVGFCCESSDSGPKNGLSYKPNKLADSSLVKLARYINTNYSQLNTTSIQQAIWAISNNHQTAAIGTNSEKEMSLKNLVSTLKNEPIPWYIIKQKIYQTGDGRIHLVNDSLLGKMAYSNNEWTYSKLNIYDTKDNAVLMSIGNWLKPGSNNVYEVALPIKNLSKGKYKLTLENEKQIFTQKDIQI